MYVYLCTYNDEACHYNATLLLTNTRLNLNSLYHIFISLYTCENVFPLMNVKLTDVFSLLYEDMKFFCINLILIYFKIHVCNRFGNVFGGGTFSK